METPLLVLTTVPDHDHAHQLAQKAVEQRLAACVNILSPATSIYRWENNIEQNTEIPLLIKTCAQCYPALENLLRSLHPYTVPEIIALPITQGLPDYLAWIASETRPATTSASPTSKNG